MIVVAVPPDPRLTEVLLGTSVGPPDETVATRFTVPEKPFRLVRVIVMLPLILTGRVSDEGDAEIVKSGPANGWTETGLAGKAAAVSTCVRIITEKMIRNHDAR